MIYNIEIPEELDEILKKIAQENNLEAQVYAQNIINGWLEGQYRGEIIKDLNKKTLEELKDIKPAISEIINPIKLKIDE